MADPDVGKLKAELIASGFRPQRFSFLVNKVRRFLWPFIRPYHFFTVDAVSERLARHSDELNRLSDNVRDLVTSQSVLRTDVAAAVNRHISIEAEWDRRVADWDRRVADWDRRLGDWETRLGDWEMRLGDWETRLGDWEMRLGDWDTRFAGSDSRVAKLDHRTRLSLWVSEYGLVILKVGDYLSDVVASEGEWDTHIVALIKEVAGRRQGIAIDVGAHIGLVSIVMARHFPQVFSYEPNRFNYALLVANMALNGLTHVRCFNHALYSRDADLSLGADAQQEIPLPLDCAGGFNGIAATNLGAYDFTENGSGVFATRAVTLDSLGIDNVVFIKIDVQGADGEVIRGAANTIRRCRPVIVFEWETLLARQFSVSLDDVRSIFLDIGYTIEVLKTHNEKQTDYVARPNTWSSSTAN
jgi:FkbM family methyltransferase